VNLKFKNEMETLSDISKIKRSTIVSDIFLKKKKRAFAAAASTI